LAGRIVADEVNAAIQSVVRLLGLVLFGAGLGALISMAGSGPAMTTVGGLLVFGCGIFVGATVYTAPALAFRLPLRPVTFDDLADHFGPGFVLAIYLGLFGAGLAFGGWVASPSPLLVTGVAGLLALLVTRQPSRSSRDIQER